MNELNNEEEIWKDVLNFEGRYQISNFGRVKTLTREVVEPRRKYIRQGKILNFYNNGGGYYKVKLYNGDASFVNFPVHRLVALHFIPNTENKLQVNHIDGNPSNNHHSNLEWCTNAENTKHAYATGLKARENYVGEANKVSKLNNEKVIEIRRLWREGVSMKSLSKQFGVVIGNIDFIVHNKTWTHLL